jgi:hypothetical protein
MDGGNDGVRWKSRYGASYLEDFLVYMLEAGEETGGLLVGNGPHSSQASFRKLTMPFSVLRCGVPCISGAFLRLPSSANTRNCATRPRITISRTRNPRGPSKNGRYESCGRSSLMRFGSGYLARSRDAVAMSRSKVSPFLMAWAYRQSLILGKISEMRRNGAVAELRRRASRTYVRRTSSVLCVVSEAKCCIVGQWTEQ